MVYFILTFNQQQQHCIETHNCLIPYRGGGTDHVHGQEQTGQEAGQLNSKCGSPAPTGLLLLHRPRWHYEEAS